MKRGLLFISLLYLSGFCFAQQKFWKIENEKTVLKLNTARPIIPETYKTLSLAFNQYKRFLQTAPSELATGIRSGLQIELPYPDNSFKRFRIVETKMMEDGLATQLPGIRTYIGQGIDEPAATVRIDYTYQGFHAYVISPQGNVFIDPYQKGNNNLYISYFAKDYENPLKASFKCAFTQNPIPLQRSLSLNSVQTATCIGTQLRAYRVAISCTHEYAEAVCPAGSITVANTMSAIVTTMNRVNGVYQTELDIKLVIIAANASVIYLNSATDPYTGNDDGSTLINESQSNITSVIGSSNFDVGHTFSTGAGGLADQGGACNNSIKAKGISGNPTPSGDAYDIDFVAHEMGHQFGAAHTFESEMGNCGNGNRITSSAYEVGSGTTIMAYAGICSGDNIQPNSSSYFHTKSFDEIIAYTTSGTGSTCPVVTNTGNHPPVVIMPASDVKIPKGTPFTLTGSATDVDGDALTYAWEEWDLTNQNSGSAWNSGSNSSVRPLFKSRIPKTSGSRTFPDTAVILANYPSNPSATMNGLKGETLPQVARDIKFRFIARDNNAIGGGVATGGLGCSSTGLFKVVVTNDGPFKLTVPNTAVNWSGGSTQTVTWNVANTNSASGINAQNVDVLMSTDGGNTFLTIVGSTPNDGSESIVVPNISTNNKVRFMIRPVGNIFFDISDVNFTITFNPQAPSFFQFTAKPNVGTILLEWTTFTEVNTKGFEILKSEGNDSSFVSVGFVPGAGNSNTSLNYSAIDTAVKKGVTYFYRIKIIDLNDAFIYSEIKSATLPLTTTFSASIWPQPFINTTNLYLDAIDKKDFGVVIYDVMGRTISKVKIRNTDESRVVPLDINKAPAGVYFIRISQNGTHITLKTVKR
jgi:hypothetical protein